MAGTFFAFSTFVMRALARLPPAQGIAAMQSINIVVINPLFMAGFIGTAAVSVALAAASLVRWGDSAEAYALAGSLLYVVGTFGVTIAFKATRCWRASPRHWKTARLRSSTSSMTARPGGAQRSSSCSARSLHGHPRSHT